MTWIKQSRYCKGRTTTETTKGFDSCQIANDVANRHQGERDEERDQINASNRWQDVAKEFAGDQIVPVSLVGTEALE